MCPKWTLFKEQNMNTSIIGNAEITSLVMTARQKWASGIKDRLEIGKIFSNLRAAVTKYEHSTKDKKKLSYNEAVRLTGIPRGTAERYREMYEVCNDNDISADVFVILAEAGFNLRNDLSKDSMPMAIFSDDPNLKSVEHLLGLSADDMETLILRLRKEYGKKEPTRTTVETLQAAIAARKGKAAETKDSDTKEALEAKIEEDTSTLHSLMLSQLRKLATVLAPFIGRNEEWVNTYIEGTKANGTFIEQRYREAVVFAQKANFLADVPKKPVIATKRPSEKVSAKG